MTAHSRMKRLLFALLPWMVATAAYGQSRSAQVIYTYHDPLSEAVYRVADECYAPVFSVEAWGWKVQLNRDEVTLDAEGKPVTVPVRTVGGKQTIPLRLALEKLGADLTWDDSTNTLTAMSQVNGVKVEDGKLQISSTLPVKANIFAMVNPARLVVDVQGAKLLPQAIVSIPSNARMKQFKPDVVRVVVETADAQKLVRSMDSPSVSLAVSLDPSAPAVVTQPLTPAPIPTENPNVDSADPGAQGQTGPPGSSPPATNAGSQQQDVSQQPPSPNPGQDAAQTPQGPHEVQISVASEDAKTTSLLVQNVGPLSGAVEFRKPDPATLDVVLHGQLLTLPEGFKLNSPSIKGTIAVQGTDVTVLRFTLSRAMGAQVTTQDDGIRIDLTRPTGAFIGNGKLAGKIICIDPGHGGHDTGAHYAGVYEKNLTLSIAKKTADAFSAAGATVIMTRETDVFIPLLERNNIADRNGADIFISIHINSNTLANSLSGGITFHHKNNDTGKLLAECVQSEIAQVSQIPDLGAWSDGKIYQSGFSVLRNASQPAILIELGFINSTKDRARLQQEDFQSDVAQAIVRGVQDFLGNGK